VCTCVCVCVCINGDQSRCGSVCWTLPSVPGFRSCCPHESSWRQKCHPTKIALVQHKSPLYMLACPVLSNVMLNGLIVTTVSSWFLSSIYLYLGGPGIHQLGFFLTGLFSMVTTGCGVTFRSLETAEFNSLNLFSALTLLAGRQEGHPACDNSCFRSCQTFCFGDPAKPAVVYKKMGQLNKKGKSRRSIMFIVCLSFLQQCDSTI